MLDLSGHDLAVLPLGLEQFSRVTTLDLSNNRL